MEQQERLRNLYPKLVERTISNEDLVWLLQYFQADNLDDLYAVIRVVLDDLDQGDSMPPSPQDTERGVKLYHRLNEQISKKKGAVRRIFLWRSIAAAAAVILLGVYIFIGHYANRNIPKNTLTHDFAPGGTGATLTLANGKKIKLAGIQNGEIANETGVVISKSKDGQLVYRVKDASANASSVNTLSTAKGETFQVRLPDGTRVWLNAASSLTYTANLYQNGQRQVKLEGEGYFEVAKDKAHPFIVQSKRQQVKVLGTHFNISDYAEDTESTTALLEGSVRINQTLLKPGQQSVLNASGIKVEPADPDQVLAWKNNEFSFAGDDLKMVMTQISRWYNVEVVYEPGAKDDIKFAGWISRDNKLSEVLKGLERAGDMHFKIEGRTVIVQK